MTMSSHPDDRSARRASPWTRGGGVRPALQPLPLRTDPARRPSPRRLRRLVDRWLPLGETSALARIVVLQHGGLDNPVITRGKKHLRFRFVSTKTGEIQLGEGKGERLLALYNEVATEVAAYKCHPWEIHLVVGGRLRRYRPDAVRQFRDGSVELIEVKRTERDLRDPEYRETLAAVREVARQCGWTFSVLELVDVEGPRPDGNPRALPHRVRNVDALFGRRTMDLSRHESRAAGRAVARGGTIAWAELRDRVAPGDPLQGDAVIERLLAGGLLATDLDQRFGPATVLAATRPFAGASAIRL